MPTLRVSPSLAAVILLALSSSSLARGADPQGSTKNDPPAPIHLTAEQDHQRTMDLLHLTALRRGVDGDPKSPHAANYEESKANPYSKLPDPLTRRNGKTVRIAQAGWCQRRPEIVEDCNRAVYGRVPGEPPKGSVQVPATSNEMD